MSDDSWWFDQDAMEWVRISAVEKAKRLRQLVIEEVSLVDCGANQHAVVSFWKGAEAMDERVAKTAGVAVEQTAGAASLQQTAEMDGAWQAIVDRAHGYMDRDLSLSEPAAIALACARHQDLYESYNAAQREASFALNQRSGSRREL